MLPALVSVKVCQSSEQTFAQMSAGVHGCTKTGRNIFTKPKQEMQRDRKIYEGNKNDYTMCIHSSLNNLMTAL